MRFASLAIGNRSAIFYAGTSAVGDSKISAQRAFGTINKHVRRLKMAELFSQEWMNGFKDRWNADRELSGALEKIGFNSTIAYGF
ncbi:MAG: hypothetical protein J5I92_05440, partial [Thiogranum sp.]|nr:hypothetical protein [Thiogranum sp.]